ncbi:S8 family peptidase [Actinokineospora auranticolor]|uniref:Subtilisin family serine protease n=1 Tax=Actinokineospora auranticolor TaxID=155976 RepID=A0A2S6GGL5_9PSEU|nr:S8 family peptidase [Actinokineospora auranticolor]PPK64352.1 subtilisin family serine protease [Actinokineospora auranticolor]
MTRTLLGGSRRRRTGFVAVLTATAVALPLSAVASAVEGDYIVVLNGTSTESVAERHGVEVDHRYNTALRGFSTRLSAREARSLAGDPAVDYVVADTPVRATGGGDQEKPPSWGLDRIDQRALPLDNHYRYRTRASDVTVYVIDTGVRASHHDFGGRVRGGHDFVDNDDDPDDGNGHGTFMAGIAGGETYGVAKGVTIVPVRVLNNSGSGSNAAVIAGIDWITAHASGPSVVNMSLGGPPNQALDDAVRRSIAAGVVYSVAAGSSAGQASRNSPARVAEAITTAAIDSSDRATSNSNFGPLVDLYAPGSGITGPWITSDTAGNTISGTSTATAHTTGAVALRLARHPDSTPAEVQDALKRHASTGVGGLPADTADRILYTGPFHH